MLAIHPQARTTPTVRREIARSPEPTGVLAKRFGVSTETIRKWRQRGVADCQDRSSRPTEAMIAFGGPVTPRRPVILPKSVPRGMSTNRSRGTPNLLL